jgi:amidase
MIHTLTKEHIVFRYDQKTPPALYVSDGDTVQIETADCFNGTIRSDQDMIPSDIDIEKSNPVTGPVFVEGLTRKDGLGLEILDIRLNPELTTGLMPGIGVLSNRYLTAQTVKGMVIGQEVVMHGYRLRLRAMIGTIGTAPPGQPVPSLLMGPHGGNMDHPVATRGSTIYLPVNIDGGLFALGDLHAAMGDGEITALSAEGSGWVSLRVHILKNQPIKRPYFKTADSWITTGQAENLQAAITMAAAEMADLLTGLYDVDTNTAASLIGVAGNIQVSQCAGVPGMDVSVRCAMPFLTKQGNG